MNYICTNKYIKHRLFNILTNKIFKKDQVILVNFLNSFFFNHAYFQSKLIFYYSRIIWSLILSKNLSNIRKIEIWQISKNYIKLWVPKFYKKHFDNKIDFLNKLDLEERIIIEHLISDLNKIFVFKSLLDKNSLKTTINEYRFNTAFPTSILKTTFGVFSKKRLKLFRSPNFFFNDKKKKKHHASKKHNNVDILAQTKIHEIRKSNYLTTAFLIIKIKLNNIFLTAVDYKGNTIYQCSGGFYDIKGQNRVNRNIVSVLAHKLCIELKRMRNIKKLVILHKTGFTNKLVKSTLKGIQSSRLALIGSIYAYNRATTFMRKRKTRRV